MEIEWRRLRADELRERARADAVVIQPVGALEQHGPHLPVEVDTLLGETVALETARLMVEKGTPTLVLPTLWTGISEHHMSFGGTITLDLETFLKVVGGVCRSIVRHGFRRIVLLNGHGGNENALRSAVDALTPELKVPIVQFTYWNAAAAEIQPILTTQKTLRHACEAETSMMMALRPELVATDRIPLAQSNRLPDVKDVVGVDLHRWRSTGSRSDSGVIGNPEAATADKGHRLVAAIAGSLAAKLGNAELWDLPWDSDPVP
jgi:creatinine amidohydrolase